MSSLAVFPWSRRKPRLAHAALVTMLFSPEQRTAYWLRITAEMEAELRRAGADDRETGRALVAFHDALAAYMARGPELPGAA